LEKPFRSLVDVDHFAFIKAKSTSAACAGVNNIHRNAATTIVPAANFIKLLSGILFGADEAQAQNY
jgi:hypothetical protein